MHTFSEKVRNSHSPTKKTVLLHLRSFCTLFARAHEIALSREHENGFSEIARSKPAWSLIAVVAAAADCRVWSPPGAGNEICVSRLLYYIGNLSRLLRE